MTNFSFEEVKNPNFLIGSDVDSWGIFCGGVC